MIDPADIELSDDDRERLVEMRGGCSCHLSPPCHNHTQPLTELEADMLGLLPEEEPISVKYIRQNLHGLRYEWSSLEPRSRCLNQRNANLTEAEAYQFRLMVHERRAVEQVGNAEFRIEGLPL